MSECFVERVAATIYCVSRDKDYSELCRDLKARAAMSKATIIDGVKHQCVDLGYCRIHVVNHKFPDGHKINECWIANRRGQTLAAGRNVTNSQVAAFVLRKFW